MRRPALDFPQRLRPHLVSLVTRPPTGDWLYETKFDGYRMLARLDSGTMLVTRSGHNWTARLPRLAMDLARLPVRGAWLDGEVVALDESGQPAFQALQSAFSRGVTDDLVYFAFDLLYVDRVDLRGRPVEQRRELLRVLLEQVDLDCVRFSPTLDADPASLLASACQLGLEGLIGKRQGSAYRGERDGQWIKLKCQNRQEFVVLGYTRAGAGLGSLLIGLHDDAGQLVYAGRVRSGFSGQQLDKLLMRLRPLQRDRSPLEAPPPLKGVRVVWVEPKLVAEIKFMEITPSGKVRACGLPRLA
ncbi:non-homologous end-joining DNA ligase [Pseudomonas sp. Marseille-P8916]|uniref:non-homologous end-joining DNA ligase n=1 Tax=Pseudomonas sp. Marseille-P8916 TaxID=2866589 RepID=UPI001CE45DA6|nr:non-homologous end-joining DNA ligase [Pseudomonas sp. Marseille-P8916]